jgi:uncharacterized membrane protein
MQGIKRKLVYVSLFEGIAIGCTTVLLAVQGHDTGHASATAVTASVAAVGWNFLYNSLFEAWEARQLKKGRGLARRIAHTLGFEGGLVLILVPLVAWWLNVTLWDALLLDLSLVLFFVVYGFVFNLAFDRVFGLPASALAA